MLFSHWPIRNKLQLGLGLLAVSVLTLFGSAYYGLYAYRGLVKSLSAVRPSCRWPISFAITSPRLHEILNQVEDRAAASTTALAVNANSTDQPVWDARPLAAEMSSQLDLFCQTLERLPRTARYQSTTHRCRASATIRYERETLAKIDEVLATHSATRYRRRPTDWLLDNEAQSQSTPRGRRNAPRARAELPSHLHERLRELAYDVRNEYRWAISARLGDDRPHDDSADRRRAAVPQMDRPAAWRRSFEGSREVAAGKFDHRIHLDSDDEMGELADAMNDMTARFQEIRDDLDRQVRERTKQVVRSEQLASVGFLGGRRGARNQQSAGVDRDVQRIARRPACTTCSKHVGPDARRDATSSATTCEMIQNEAFRCKEITEKLLDFSRMGDARAAQHRLARAGRRRDRHGPPPRQVSETRTSCFAPVEPVDRRGQRRRKSSRSC